jgi:hypothetical protein
MSRRLKSDCQKAKVAVYRTAGHPNEPTVIKCTDTCLKSLRKPKIIVSGWRVSGNGLKKMRCGRTCITCVALA